MVEAGIEDVEMLIAAVLHDTVEDTKTTLDEIEGLFGKRVRDLVAEVTDDKSLSKATRKRLQISHAKDISDDAKIIKMADKLHNLTSFTLSPPKDWSAERIQGYFVWSKAVLDNMKGVNQYLEDEITKLFNTRDFMKGDLDDLLNNYLSQMEIATD